MIVIFFIFKMILTLLDRFNNFLVFVIRHIAIWILAAMMFLTAADVCLSISSAALSQAVLSLLNI
jgi:hypothetical protein